MRISPAARLTDDLVLLAGIVALSCLPAAGTQQTHFAIAAGTLRIFAVVYAVVVALRGHGLISDRTRMLLDCSATAILAVMAWSEQFPAGNHLAEIGIYGGVAFILASLTATSRPAPLPAEAA